MPTRPTNPVSRDVAMAARNASLAQLRGCLPELIAAESQLAAAAAREGIVYRIADYGGLRTEAQTATILRYREDDYKAAVKADPRIASIPINKWRPIAPFGQSFHNYGGSFDTDVQMWPASMTRGQAMGRLATLAPTVGLRNGASWQDLPHMELPVPLATVKVRYLAMSHPVASKVGVGVVAVAALAVVVLAGMR